MLHHFQYKNYSFRQKAVDSCQVWRLFAPKPVYRIIIACLFLDSVFGCSVSSKFQLIQKAFAAFGYNVGYGVGLL